MTSSRSVDWGWIGRDAGGMVSVAGRESRIRSRPVPERRNGEGGWGKRGYESTADASPVNPIKLYAFYK